MKNRTTVIILAAAVFLSALLSACGQSAEDKKFDELTAQSSAPSAPEEPVSSEPEESQPDTDLTAQLVLRTYTSGASVDIWKDYIREFNETYPNVKIELKDEDALSDVAGYITRTTVELMSGEAGDLIDMSWLPAQRYSASGVLQALDPLMDADPDFAGDKYYRNVLDGMRCGGRLYVMPYEFAPIGIRLDKKAADALEIPYGTGEAIGASQVLEYAAAANQLPDFADMPALGLFTWDAFNFVELSSRINEEEKSADLDSESFIAYLTKLKAAKYNEGAPVGASPMPDDGQLMGGFCTITSLRPAYVQLAESYVGLLDSPDVTPMMALETDEGEALFTSMGLGVTSSCKEPETAFAFIKFLLDNERRLDAENSMRTDFVPVNRELSQKVLEAYLGEAGKEETEKLDQWCARVSTPVFYDRSRELLDKLNDICGQYMNGLLSAEDCARQLQDMAFVYLNE